MSAEFTELSVMPVNKSSHSIALFRRSSIEVGTKYEGNAIDVHSIILGSTAVHFEVMNRCLILFISCGSPLQLCVDACTRMLLKRESLRIPTLHA